MKNTFLVIILMIGMLVTMAMGNQVKAKALSHPELVSGTLPQPAGHPELAELISAPPTELVSASCPETTISASISSSIETTVGDLEPVGKGNFFSNNWGALLMGLLGFADLVTRLTPSVKDNSILNFLSSVINAIIPNLKKGGGRL